MSPRPPMVQLKMGKLGFPREVTGYIGDLETIRTDARVALAEAETARAHLEGRNDRLSAALELSRTEETDTMRALLAEKARAAALTMEVEKLRNQTGKTFIAFDKYAGEYDFVDTFEEAENAAVEFLRWHCDEGMDDSFAENSCGVAEIKIESSKDKDGFWRISPVTPLENTQ